MLPHFELVVTLGITDVVVGFGAGIGLGATIVLDMVGDITLGFGLGAEVLVVVTITGAWD